MLVLRDGPSSMPKVLPPHVRRQLKPTVCDLSEAVDCSARAEWGHGVSGNRRDARSWFICAGARCFGVAVGAFRTCLGKTNMKLIFLAVVAIALSATTALAQRAAQPQSREALYMKCSREVAQKYGQPGIQYGTKSNYRIIPHTHLTVIDQCVANGGRLN
jgi:hypothetical protein